MERSVLGRTGLAVSRLGFGASPLGGVFGPVAERDAREAVACALAGGVNYFDVAPYYGDGLAETVLGRCLAGVPRSDLVVSTKVGRYGVERFDFTRSTIRASVSRSLDRLRVDVIDLVFCHDIEFVPFPVIRDEALPALAELRDEGLLRHIGVSGLPLGIFGPALATGMVEVVLSYCHGTLIDATLERLLPEFRRAGTGVVNASPFAMGLLTGRTLPGWHPASDRERQIAASLATWCREQGGSLPRLAIQFAAQRVDADTLLAGMACRAEVEANLRHLQDRDLQDMERLVACLGRMKGHVACRAD
jgi:L-galactose dehydrogenase